MNFNAPYFARAVTLEGDLMTKDAEDAMTKSRTDGRRFVNQARLNRILTRLDQINRAGDAQSMTSALGALEPFDTGRLRKLMEILAAKESAQEAMLSIASLLHYLFNPIELVITNVSPTTAWPDKHITVSYTLTNKSTQTTSGLVTADIMQWPSSVARSGWSAHVDNLQPGTTSTHQVVIRSWPSVNIAPGVYSVDLRYWVQDDNGSITFVRRDPITGEQNPITYGLAADDWADIELYPTCQPDGPDYLQIKSFILDPPLLISDSTGQSAAPGTTATVKWEVDSGGFPAEGAHPGSISSVKLVGGFSTDPKHTVDVPAVGQVSVPIIGIPSAYLVQPWTLIATGNCGAVKQTGQFQFQLAPPKIVSFEAVPNYINVGASAQLQWNVACPGACSVGIQGHDGLGKTVLNLAKLPLQGSKFVQPAWNTKYTLTCTNPSGSISSDLWVTLHAPSQGCTVFFLKMFNPQSAVTPCFTIAVCAQNEQAAIQMAQNANGGYTAEKIDEAQFLSACG